MVNLKSNVHILWEKTVKDSYLISFYNPNLYLIFTKKFKEKNKLIIPINRDNPYKLEIKHSQSPLSPPTPPPTTPY